MIPPDLLDRLRVFDAFPKTLEDFRIKTSGGAAVTVTSCVLAILLFVSELTYYLTPELSEELLVDVSRGDRMRINFDVVFPHISCPYLAIDAIDVSGEQQINIQHNIYKRRMDKEGKFVDEGQKQETIGISKKQQFLDTAITSTASTSTLNPGRCESCYGAESGSRKCCNTCNDVRDAYTEKGWALKDFDTIEQCRREGVKTPVSAMTEEGCQIYGHIDVARVQGNLHIAPGRSMSRHHRHIHDLSAFESNLVNTSHTIKTLSFGQDIPGQVNPLDGSVNIADHTSMSFQYYIKIVGSMFTNLDGDSLLSNQFAVTRNKKRTDEVMSETSLPGVFFIYEFAPMMIKYTERRRSFLHFLTSVFAIIGGVFTVAGMVDSVVYFGVNVIKKKMELGKQT